MFAYVVNPGSASVRLALAEIRPSDNPGLPGQLRVTLDRRELPFLQLGRRPEDTALTEVIGQLVDLAQGWPAPDAVVSRASRLEGAQPGAYRVTPELASHLLEQGETAEDGTHLAAALALGLAEQYAAPAYVIDPPGVDERLPEARLSGLPDVERSGQYHVLNARAVARRAAYEVGKRFQDARVVVAHLGVGVSVTAFDRGRAIDTSGTEGAFGVTRTGPLPLPGLLDLAYSQSRPELERLLKRHAGFLGLSGTADLRELEAREDSDPGVRLAADAFALQVVKALGAYSAALPGRPDALALTGGIARWDALIDRIERRVAWIAPVLVVPGELELEALAEGAGRVLMGLEDALTWSAPQRAAH